MLPDAERPGQTRVDHQHAGAADGSRAGVAIGAGGGKSEGVGIDPVPYRVVAINVSQNLPRALAPDARKRIVLAGGDGVESAGLQRRRSRAQAPAA